MIEDQEMSYLEKSKLPFELLFDPLENRAAAYTSNHRLITPMASAKLMAFAMANQDQQQAWNESMYKPAGRWRPMPDWATPEVRARCVLIWIKRGGQSDDYFASIPKK